MIGVDWVVLERWMVRGGGDDGLMVVLIEWRGSGAGGAGCRVVLVSLVYFQLSGLRFRFLDFSFSTTGEL